MSSKLHRRVLRLTKEILGTSIREEVNVQKLFPSYHAKDHHFDLVLPAYNLVIECHGEQHRSLQGFGEKDTEKMVVNLHGQKRRDSQKEEIVWENCWGYLSVWHDELPKDDTEAKKLLSKKIITAIERIETE